MISKWYNPSSCWNQISQTGNGSQTPEVGCQPNICQIGYQNTFEKIGPRRGRFSAPWIHQCFLYPPMSFVFTVKCPISLSMIYQYCIQNVSFPSGCCVKHVWLPLNSGYYFEDSTAFKENAERTRRETEMTLRRWTLGAQVCQSSRFS